MRAFAALPLGLLLSMAAEAPSSPEAPALERIKEEGGPRSRVMETAAHLADVIGSRLTNSPQFREATRWTSNRLREWGLDARVEPWGTFGRGWSLRRFSAQVVEPQAIPLVAFPRAWSPGTPGELVADVVLLDATDPAGLERYRGRLRGRIVLVEPPVRIDPRFTPRATRWSDADMARFAADEPFPPHNANFAPPPTPEERAAREMDAARLRLVHQEGAAVLIAPSRKFDGGAVAAGAAEVPQAAGVPRAQRVRAWHAGAPAIVPQIVVAVEHYNRVARLARRGGRVRMAVDLRVRFHDEDATSSNTIGEIRGTDLADEVVMLGAHLDSWHAGTGATDDAAGVAVVMEAVRIIRAAGLRPRRTIRVALWGGHEQGGGSTAWVARNLDGPEQSHARDRLSLYVNMDAGTGRFRGAYAFGNAALRPILAAWLEPFRDLGATVVTLNPDWESDFIPFEEAGIPVVSFIQDEIELETLTHHSNQDVFDRLVEADLRQASVIMAGVAYQAAMREGKLPRKPR